MAKKILILILVVVIILVSGLVLWSMEKAKTPTPKETVISTDKTWLNEGPIYETHPYYYPNHSFKEITQQIPELKDLGVETIYLMPIWEHEIAPETGMYRYEFIYHILNEYAVDPEFGTKAELKELADTAHAYNMKVVFDLVTCCAFDGGAADTRGWVLNTSVSALKAKGIELGYTKEVKGKRYIYANCIQNPAEPVASTCDVFGSLNGDKIKLFVYPMQGYGMAVDRANPEAIEYFTGVAEHYVREYGIDGWRIDAPANVWNPNIISGEHSALPLLRRAKDAVTNANSGAIFLSENSALMPFSETPDSGFDEVAEASYQWKALEKVSAAVKGMNPKEFVNMINSENISYNRTRIYYLETHGHQRIASVSPQLNRPLLVMISTIPGVPMIQAGQEIGAKNRFRTDAQVDWSGGDYALRDFYKKVFAIRNSHPALKYGGKESISNVWKSGDNIYAYLRSYENEKVVVVINFLDKEATSILDLSFLAQGTVLYDELNNERFTVNEPNNFSVSVPAYGLRILTIKR